MGDVYMVNGKILSGLPNHAKDIIFDNTGSPLVSTNTEDAIKEVNSNLSASVISSPINVPEATPYTANKHGYILVTAPSQVANDKINIYLDSVRLIVEPVLNGGYDNKYQLYIPKGGIVSWSRSTTNAQNVTAEFYELSDS